MAGLSIGGNGIVDAPVSSTLVADVNNAPSLQVTTALITASGADRTITGLIPVAAGQLVIFINVGPTFNVVIAGESASSSAANRFATGTTIFPNGAQAFIYDGGSSRWRRAFSR